jgi:hypothetical protein
MNATDLAAWWGAIIATCVLGLEIYKLKKSGPVIDVSASPDMETFGGIPAGLQNKTFVVVKVTNAGDRNTTITHLIGFHYSSWFKRFRKKRKAFVVVNPALSRPLPHVLGPGEEWIGGIEQNPELEEMSRNGYLYCGVYHSCGKKPVLQRVVVQDANNT